MCTNFYIEGVLWKASRTKSKNNYMADTWGDIVCDNCVRAHRPSRPMNGHLRQARELRPPDAENTSIPARKALATQIPD